MGIYIFVPLVFFAIRKVCVLKIPNCCCFLPFMISQIYHGRCFKNLLGIFIKLISNHGKGKTPPKIFGKESLCSVVKLTRR